MTKINGISKTNKALYIFVALILILFAIFTTLYFYVNSSNFRGNVKSVIIKQLENILEKRVEIGSIDAITWNSLQLTHFFIFEDNNDTNEILFKSEKAEAQFFLFLPSLQELKEWQFNIKKIIFTGADLNITRDINGDFDLTKKLSLNQEVLEGRITLEEIGFQDSFLIYHDESVHNYYQNQLTTRAKEINGFFDLTGLPEIKLDLKGIQNPDGALLSLSGSFFVNKIEYSLNFYLQNADITHFQYYLESADQFNIRQGNFDLKLNLSFSQDWDTDEIFWQGEAIFHKTNIEPLFLKKIPFQEINGSVVFIKPEINITELSGLYYGQPIKLEGQVRTEPGVQYILNMEGKQLDTSLLKDDIAKFTNTISPIDLKGMVDLSGNITGLPDYYSFIGRVNSPEIKIDNGLLFNISGDFSLNNNSLTINSLKSIDSNSQILVNGDIDWSGNIPAYHFFIETSNLSLEHPFLQQFPFLKNGSGNIDSKLTIESEIKDDSLSNLSGSISIKNMRIGDIHFPEPLESNFSSIINLSDNLLFLNKCELHLGNDTGNLNGNLKFEELINFMLDFDLQISNLSRYSSSIELDSEIAGNANLKGQIKGNSNNPEIKLSLQLAEFSINNNQFEELDSNLFYKDNSLSIESFVLSSHGMELSGEGNILIPTTKKPEIKLTYYFSTLKIEQLQEILGYSLPLSGQIKGNGSIHGLWPDVVIDNTIHLENIVYQNYYFGDGKIDFILEKGQENASNSQNEGKYVDNFYNIINQQYIFTLKQLELKNHDMKLFATGLLNTKEGFPFSLKMDLSHQKFDEMVTHFYPTEENLNKYLPRHVIGEITCEGNMEKQEVVLLFQLIPQQTENNPPSKLEALISKDNDGFHITDLQLIQSEGSFVATGIVTTNGNLNIEFQASQLDISTLISLIQVEEKVNGIMNINGTIAGTLKQPEVSVSVQIREGYFREFKFENLSSELIWNSLINLISIKELNIVLEKEYQIRAKGNIPVKSLVNTLGEDINSLSSYSDIPLDFQINMNKVGLNVLKVFWKDLFSEITGTADLEIYLTGTAGNPIMNGTVSISETKVDFTDLPIEIEEINETINIINNRITIPSISFAAFDNNFNIYGEFELTNFLPDNLYFTIKNENKRIVYQNILESDFDLELTIEKSIVNPYISGQVSLSNGVLYVNNLSQMEKDSLFTATPSNFLNNSSDQLDINISLQEPFKLKMNNADIDIGGKIILNGMLTEPMPKGSLVLKKGYFLYFDKKFSISDGLITINGLDSRNIELNARATTNVQGVQVNINVLGSLSNPQILLSSQPSLKETEIISLLTFDRNIQGLSEGEINQLLSEEMANIIFQSLQLNLFKRMEREIAEGLGLEFLRISFNNHDDGSAHFFFEDLHLSDLTLEVGKNIGDDLLITYSTPLDFHGETSISLDYKITPDFTFSTQLDTYSFEKEDYKIKFGLEIRF